MRSGTPIPAKSAASSMSLSCRCRAANLRLAVEDDGIGLQAPDEESGIGSRLIEAFAHQVGGTASVHRRDTGGTTVELIFDDPEAEGPPTRPDHSFPQRQSEDYAASSTLAHAGGASNRKANHFQ